MRRKERRVWRWLFAAVVALFVSAATIWAVSPGDWTGFQNSGNNNGVVDAHGPENESEASLRFAVKVSNKSVTPPVIIDGKLYVASADKVYCLDRYTGKVLAKSTLNLSGGVSYGMFPMAYDGKGLLFIPVTGGRVQAVDLNTLDPVWITAKPGGEAASLPPYGPVTYSDGMIYYGLWGDQTTYVAADASRDGGVSAGVKTLKWSFPEYMAGCYWAGAYVGERKVYFGSDASRDAPEGASSFYAVNKDDGSIADRIDNVSGSVRTTPVYYDGCLFFASKGGRVYKVRLSADGTFGRIDSIDLNGEITTTPVINDNRLYVGVKAGEGGRNRYEILKISENGLEKGSSVNVSGYPQGAPLLSTAVRNDGKPGATVYYTYNARPGGLYSFADSVAGASASFRIFEPKESDQKQMCISQLAADEEGTIYYINDSGYLFAVERKAAYLSKVVFSQQDMDGSSLGAVLWENSYTPGGKHFSLVLDKDARKVSLDTMQISEGGTLQLTINGRVVPQDEPISLDGNGRLQLTATVTGKGQVREYVFSFRKNTEEAGFTSLLLTTSGDYQDKGSNLLTSAFEADTRSYSTAKLDSSKGPYYLWVMPLSGSSTTKFLAAENVKDYQEGEEIIDYESPKDGSRMLKLVPGDSRKSVTVKVQNTSYDGRITREYQVVVLVKGQSSADDASGNPAEQGKRKDSSGTSGMAVPAKVKLTKVKAGKKKITVCWKRLPGNTKGYQIEVKPVRNARKLKVRTLTVKQGRGKTMKVVVKTLAGKTRFTVRVRAYNRVSGKICYGKWSSARTVKVKR